MAGKLEAGPELPEPPELGSLLLADEQGKTWRLGLALVSENGQRVEWRLTPQMYGEKAKHSFILESPIIRVEGA